MTEYDPSQVVLEARIRELTQELENGLRARGFDPAQLENLPLTPALARLKAERDEMIERLERYGNHD